MYNTDDELDKELDELKEKIRLENQEKDGNDEDACDDTQDEEKTLVDVESETVRALKRFTELSTDGVTDDELIPMIADAFGLMTKKSGPKIDSDVLLEEEERIKQIYAEFDILEELRNNLTFKKLIANGITVHQALVVSNVKYEELVVEQIKKDAKREMAQSLRLGKERITSQSVPRSSGIQIDVTRLSDEQFEEIEEKVKQNKKVYL